MTSLDQAPVSGVRPATVDDLLAAARARLRRLDPAAAAAARERGALLVDIRSEAQRVAQGEIPGAVIVERTVLEWRLDPASPHRLPQIDDHSRSRQIVVVCSEGYSSSLAAAVLQDLGLTGATDLVGGFEAWARAGLPVTRPIPR